MKYGLGLWQVGPVKVYPLYSTLPPQQQQKIFEPVRPRYTPGCCAVYGHVWVARTVTKKVPSPCLLCVLLPLERTGLACRAKVQVLLQIRRSGSTALFWDVRSGDGWCILLMLSEGHQTAAGESFWTWQRGQMMLFIFV